MSSPTCLACGGAMQAFTDKRGKPFAKCGPCGAQFFVRSKQGCERFVARYGTPTKTAAPAPEPAKPAAPASKPTPEGAPGEKKDDYWNW